MPPEGCSITDGVTRRCNGHRAGRMVAAIAAAHILSSLPAAAEDDGTDDFDARIAELESVSARSANTTIKVEVSGHVHRALLSWWDGEQSDTYIADPTNWGSYVQIAGETRASGPWHAGFLLSFDVPINESFSLSQTVSSAGGEPIVGKSTVYMSHDKLGRFSFGRISEAHDHITENDGSNTGLFAGPAITDWNASFALRGAGTALLQEDAATWLGLSSASIGDGDNANAVRYDSPDMSGLQLSASWADDRVSALSVSYSQEADWADMSASAATAHYAGDSRTPCTSANNDGGCTTLAGSFTIGFKPSLFSVSLAGGMIANDPDNAWMYGKIAQELSLFEPGGTVFYAEGFQGVHTQGPENLVTPGFATLSAHTTSFGLGVMQFLDEADTQLYAAWRVYRIDGEAVAATGGLNDELSFEPFHAVTIGSRISF